jgi:hypothetical protein
MLSDLSAESGVGWVWANGVHLGQMANGRARIWEFGEAELRDAVMREAVAGNCA